MENIYDILKKYFDNFMIISPIPHRGSLANSRLDFIAQDPSPGCLHQKIIHSGRKLNHLNNFNDFFFFKIKNYREEGIGASKECPEFRVQ